MAHKVKTDIVVNPDVVHGKPVIRGTRVPVEVVLGGLAAGMSVSELAQEYGLTRPQIQSAIRYAHDVIEPD